jgi:O-antigen/teichoic acid export membrane protein
MLIFIVAGLGLAACAFVVPLNAILRISGPQNALAWTVFWLALQVLANLPLGQIIGVYRTFGQAHRGVMWTNLYRILLLAVTIGLAALHAPFWLIAAGQVLGVLAILFAVILFLRWSKPEICPRLNYWDSKLAKEILKPSAFFGLFMVNNFLVYQAPILMLQRFVGAQAVVVFSVGRTLFSFVRQGASLVQQGITPELGRLNGKGEREKLVRVYLLFEGVVLATVLIVNTGILLAGPILVRFWLKRPELFDLTVFVPLMLVTVILSVKEYKVNFQCATNQHIRTGLATFVSYVAMVLISLPVILWFGVLGFLSVWFAVELIQLALVHSHNARFLGGNQKITLRPAMKLAAALVGIVLLILLSRSLLESRYYVLQGATAFFVMAALATASYFLFDLREILREGKGQFLKIRFG